LAGAKHDDRPLYYALGVFEQTASVPKSAIISLWQQLNPSLTDLDCCEIQNELVRLDLIESIGEMVRLHDLLHDYASGKLGDRLVSMHADLLRVFNSDSRPWSDVEDDGYLYDHLAYHLRALGASDQLRGLFNDDRWLQVR